MVKVPILPLVAVVFELVALAIVTLVLVSPAPFQHCDISFLTIVPQPPTVASLAANASTSSAEQPNATSSSLQSSNDTLTQPVSKTNSVQAQSQSPSPSDDAQNARQGDAAAQTSKSGSNAPTTSANEGTIATGGSANAGASAPTAVSASDSPSRRASFVRRGDSGRVMESLNKTNDNQYGLNGTSIPAKDFRQSQSQLRFRMGPLGSCFRTDDGSLETCTPALLHPAYDYAGLLRAMSAAMTGNTSTAAGNSSTSGNNSISMVSKRQVIPAQTSSNFSKTATASTSASTTPSLNTSSAESGSSAVSSLPSTLSSYPTILLIIVVCIALISSVWTVQAILMIRIIRRSTLAGIPVHLTPAWSKWGQYSGILSLLATIVLLIATGVQKYALAQAKNAFNSAQPMTLSVPPLAKESNGRLFASSEAVRQSIPLVADTGNAFGFLWISCALLFVAFWVRRIWIRRQRAQALASASIQTQDEENAGKGTEDDRTAPVSILMKQPSSKSAHKFKMEPSTSTITVDMYGSRDGVAPKLRHKGSLPSLYTAHSWHDENQAKNSPPPFSMYQGNSMVGHSYGGAFGAYGYGKRGCCDHDQAQSHPDACRDAPESLHDEFETIDMHSVTPQYHLYPARPTIKRPFATQQLQQQDHGGAGPIPMPYRSASPAPSYLTKESLEKERQYMANMRRRREAEAARYGDGDGGSKSNCGH